MESKICGYHLDKHGDWVAELDCGHNQHVRHNPPMESRPWVETKEGRTRFLNFPLQCVLCDERENGTAGKVMNVFSGRIRKFKGSQQLPSDSQLEFTGGKWIDVQTGDDVPCDQRVWESSMDKQPVIEPVKISELGIVGDEQADTKNHGGIDKAVCLYPSEHYSEWEQAIGRRLTKPAFGENFSTEGLLERAVCVGDRFSIGSVILEVSQPRQPCWKIATRWNFPTLAKEFLKRAKTGWYFRVLQTGIMKPEDTLILEERPFADWTVERVVKARFGKGPENTDRPLLKEISPLASSWKK